MRNILLIILQNHVKKYVSIKSKDENWYLIEQIFIYYLLCVHITPSLHPKEALHGIIFIADIQLTPHEDPWPHKLHNPPPPQLPPTLRMTYKNNRIATHL